MVNAVSLEHLEAEFAASLLCRTCALAGEERAAVAVAVYRTVCGYGVPLPAQPEPDYLVCREHADALLHFRIGDGGDGRRGCGACGHDVSGEMWSHVIERVAPIGLSR